MVTSVPESHTNCRAPASEPAQKGATWIEYIIVLTLLGFVIYGTVFYFQPQSEEFHLEMKSGLGISYPSNYIPEPTATAAVTATTAPAPVEEVDEEKEPEGK